MNQLKNKHNFLVSNDKTLMGHRANYISFFFRCWMKTINYIHENKTVSKIVFWRWIFLIHSYSFSLETVLRLSIGFGSEIKLHNCKELVVPVSLSVKQKYEFCLNEWIESNCWSQFSVAIWFFVVGRLEWWFGMCPPNINLVPRWTFEISRQFTPILEIMHQKTQI